MSQKSTVVLTKLDRLRNFFVKKRIVVVFGDNDCVKARQGMRVDSVNDGFLLILDGDVHVPLGRRVQVNDFGVESVLSSGIRQRLRMVPATDALD